MQRGRWRCSRSAASSPCVGVRCSSACAVPAAACVLVPQVGRRRRTRSPRSTRTECEWARHRWRHEGRRPLARRPDGAGDDVGRWRQQDGAQDDGRARRRRLRSRPPRARGGRRQLGHHLSLARTASRRATTPTEGRRALATGRSSQPTTAPGASTTTTRRRHATSWELPISACVVTPAPARVQLRRRRGGGGGYGN